MGRSVRKAHASSYYSVTFYWVRAIFGRSERSAYANYNGRPERTVCQLSHGLSIKTEAICHASAASPLRWKFSLRSSDHNACRICGTATSKRWGSCRRSALRKDPCGGISSLTAFPTTRRPGKHAAALLRRIHSSVTIAKPSSRVAQSTGGAAMVEMPRTCWRILRLFSGSMI